MPAAPRVAALLTLAALAGCGQLPGRAQREAHVSKAQAADIQVALGRSMEAQGDVDKALIAYADAARLDPRRGEASRRRAVLLDKNGRFAEAAPLYEAALKASPGDAEVFADKGYSLMLQGKDADAERCLRQAIAAAPKLARAHNNLGLLMGRTGREGEALAEFADAGVGEVDARANLAFALGQSRRFEQARKQVAVARALGPSKEHAEGLAAVDDLIGRAQSAGDGIQQSGLPPLP